MSCNQSNKYIKSELSRIEFAEHMKICPVCAERMKMIDQTMAILDVPVKVPSALAEKVLRHRRSVIIRPVKNIDYHKYLQLAAVVAIGIFLGTFLGKNAESGLFNSKKDKKDKAMIELLEKHHLYDQNSFYRF